MSILSKEIIDFVNDCDNKKLDKRIDKISPKEAYAISRLYQQLLISMVKKPELNGNRLSVLGGMPTIVKIQNAIQSMNQIDWVFDDD